MADLYDYLAWRGDLTFAQAPFNEVDNLICAWLSYVDLTDVFAQADFVTIREASDAFFRTHERRASFSGTESLNPMLTATRLLDTLSGAPRFQNVVLTRFVSQLDYEREKQFAALTLLLDDERAYVAYRGTDHTIVGWKEDFNMSFQPVVPAQEEARRYLERVAAEDGRLLIVGGHSKGGNLAVFAASTCGEAVGRRILTVYNNDGPGFNEDFLDSEGYRAMLGRIVTIVPQSSVVGMLLGHEEHYRIVKSAQIGLLQHNALNWEVQGPRFVHHSTMTRSSALIDRKLKDWLHGLSEDDRREFLDTLYAVVDQTGAKTIEQLTAQKLRSLARIVKSIVTLNGETRAMLLRVVKGLLKTRDAAKGRAPDSRPEEDCEDMPLDA